MRRSLGPANANACVMCRLTTKYWWVLNQRSLSVFGMCLLFVFGTAFSIYRMRYGMRAESAPEGGEKKKKKNTILPIVQPSIASSLLHLFYHQSWCVWFSSIYFFSFRVRPVASLFFVHIWFAGRILNGWRHWHRYRHTHTDTIHLNGQKKIHQRNKAIHMLDDDLNRNVR